MELKLNVTKKGINTTPSVINEEYTLNYGHIFRAKSDYTDADKALVQTIPNKQDKLTLAVKDNGNIVIGNIAGQTKEFMPATPSGDPMHYAYINAGAEWSNGGWVLNGISLTNDEIAELYKFQGVPIGRYSYASNNLIRTYFPLANAPSASAQYCFQSGTLLEVVPSLLGGYKYVASMPCDGMFSGCRNLRSIALILFNPSSLSSAFDNCNALEDVLIEYLNSNVSFAHSPKLSKESLLHMINNCTSGKTFTITLHSDVYNKACVSTGAWYSDVQSALASAKSNKSTTITLGK